jgi:hypothetical protein
MSILRAPSFRRRIPYFSSPALVFLLCLALPLVLQAQRVTLAARTPGLSSSADAVDIGPVPASQPIQLTVRLALAADRSAALDQLLTSQNTVKSAAYHQWLTPQQFATQFGATDDQIAAATAWLQSQGFTVEAVSPSKMRMAVSGTASQIQSAFAVSLRNYQAASGIYFANATRPSLPETVASMIAGVSGLDNMPAPASFSLATAAPTADPHTVSSSNRRTVDPFTAAAASVDANTTPILTFSGAACSTDFAQSDYDAYHDLFRQANAQGMTILATSGCGARGTGSFPASLAEVTALTITPTAAPFAGIAPRPGWQSAAGLPEDGNRDEPDLTTTSLTGFAQTINTIVQQTGVRQGNINGTLYALAPTPDLYTQPDATPATAAGAWEPATGLGVVNLATLLKVYPRATGSTATTTSLTSSSYTVNYGQPFTLTSVVSPSTTVNNAMPTGTVSFNASQGTIGSAVLNNGTATLTLGSLGVGTYTVVASYAGDANYAASTSTGNVIITVGIVNASLTAVISPASNVPYGATATVTATVTLPTSSAAPSGTVSAQVEGVVGSNFSAMLSPNPGGNSATANIVVSVPAPSTYTIEVTCAGNQNFQCQTPVNIPFSSIKGNSVTSLSVTPSAPQAGQPISLTASIGDAGNGVGPYSYTGNVTFYDNGKILATAAVGTNQATTTAILSGNVTHNIIANYSGDSNWSSSASAAQAVSPALLPASLNLSSNISTDPVSLAGTSLIITATVFTTASNTVGPTGTVTFFDTFGGSVIQLGIANLTPNGPNQSIAVFSSTGYTAGMHSVYGIYNGDSNFMTATSTPLALTFSDFNLTMVPQTLTVNAGQGGQVVMLLGSIGNFSGTVTFGCTPPPNTETTCSFSPVSLTGGGSTTMSITTTAAVIGSARRAALERRWNAGAGAVFATIFCLVMPRRRRLLPTLLLLLCAVCLTAELGCGSGTTSTPTPSSDPGSPLGSQIFTITTAGSNGISTVRHTYQYQVTIQ